MTAWMLRASLWPTLSTDIFLFLLIAFYFFWVSSFVFFLSSPPPHLNILCISFCVVLTFFWNYVMYT